MPTKHLSPIGRADLCKNLLALVAAACFSCGPKASPVSQTLPDRSPLREETFNYFLASQLALHEERWQEVAPLLTQALAQSPKVIGLHLYRIDHLIRVGQWEEASKAIQQAKEQFPNSPALLRVDADLLWHQGDHRAAHLLYGKYLRDSNSQLQSNLRWASSHPKEDGRYRASEKLVKLFPQSFEAWQLFGRTSYQVGLCKEFLSKKLPSEYPEVTTIASMCRKRLGRIKPNSDLVALYDRENGAPWVAETIALEALELAGLNEARALITGLWRSDLNRQAQVGLLFVLAELGSHTEVLKRLSNSPSLARENLSLLLDSLATSSGLRTAQDLANTLLQKDKVAPEIIIAAATIELQLGNNSTALALLKKGLRQYPQEADLSFALLRTLWESNAREEALALLSNLQKTRPQSFRLHSLQTEWDRIANTPTFPPLCKELKNQPTSAALLNSCGYHLLAMPGYRKLARRYLLRALMHAPNNPSILDSVGWMHALEGKYELSVQHLDRAARLLPFASEVHAHKAKVLSHLRRHEEAQNARNESQRWAKSAYDRAILDLVEKAKLRSP